MIYDTRKAQTVKKITNQKKEEYLLDEVHQFGWLYQATTQQHFVLEGEDSSVIQ